MPVTNYDMSEIAMWNMYKESYDFMMGHPIVKQIKKENKKLKKEVAHLKAMLAITQENMRLMIEYNRTKFATKKTHKPLYTKFSDIEDIIEVVDLQGMEDDITPVSESQKDEPSEQPNIKYEIIENYVNVEEDGEEEVEVEGEVEGEEEEEVEEVEAVEEGEEEEEVEVVEEEVVEEEVEEVEAAEEGEEEVEAVEEGEEEGEVVEEEEEEVEEVEAEEEVEVVEEEEEEVEVVEEEEEEEEEVEVVEEEGEDETEVAAPTTVEPTEESDEEEVFEIIIDGKTYYTDDREWGTVYDIDENGEINMEVGKFSNGVVKFY